MAKKSRPSATPKKKKVTAAANWRTRRLPTSTGGSTIHGFQGNGPQEEAVALVRGNVRGTVHGKGAPLVRVHSQCLTGDVLNSLRCDCRAQLELALPKNLPRVCAGILLYLPQEGRGDWPNESKLRAYQLQDGGLDTVEANESLGFAADARDYDFSAQILKALGAKKIRLLSNNPEKVRQLESAGIRVRATRALPAAGIQTFARLSANQKRKKCRAPDSRRLRGSREFKAKSRSLTSFGMTRFGSVDTLVGWKGYCISYNKPPTLRAQKQGAQDGAPKKKTKLTPRVNMDVNSAPRL